MKITEYTTAHHQLLMLICIIQYMCPCAAQAICSEILFCS